GEGGDATRAVATGDAAVGIGREFHGLAHLGENFFDEESGVLIAERVVFETAVATGFLSFLCGGDHARVDENADSHGNVTGVDEIVEDGGRAERAIGFDKPASVETDEDAGGAGAVVLGGHVDPVVAFGVFKNVAFPMVFGDFALRDALFDLRIGTGDVVLVGAGERGGKQKTEDRDGEERAFHTSGEWNVRTNLGNFPEFSNPAMASGGGGIADFRLSLRGPAPIGEPS